MEFERVRKEFFVKEHGDTVGLLSVVEDCPNSRRTIVGQRVYLQDLKVEEAYRRKGYATGLLTYVIDWYEKQGIDEVTIAVDSDNTIAKRLYKKLGFQLLQYGYDCYRNQGYELLIHKKEGSNDKEI